MDIYIVNDSQGRAIAVCDNLPAAKRILTEHAFSFLDDIHIHQLTPDDLIGLNCTALKPIYCIAGDGCSGTPDLVGLTIEQVFELNT